MLKNFLRKTIIKKNLIGLEVKVHNGKTFYKLKITEHMIGHKLGEFIFTRKKFVYKKKKKDGSKH